jgi:hypothetical protein
VKRGTSVSREAENFADNPRRKRGGELIWNAHFPLRVDAVNEPLGDRADSRPQLGDQSGRKYSGQRRAAPAMVWFVRKQHAVLVEVEQSAFGNTPGLQQVRLDLACTRIRRETFDVFGENGDVTAIVAFDQRLSGIPLAPIGIRPVLPRWDATPCQLRTAISRSMGIDNLRIADGSIMPRVTTGNTMAPCVIIGERGGEVLKAEHEL